MVGDGLKVALAVLLNVSLLLIANYGYGLAHELAHAAVVDALGGEVYGIYVNPLGTDAYVEHVPVAGALEILLLNLAGLGATTCLAIASLPLGKSPLTVFLSMRTFAYALNYASGTDISHVYGAVGPWSLGLSLLIASVNVACVYWALKGEKRLTGLASFSTRARPARSSA